MEFHEKASFSRPTWRQRRRRPHRPLCFHPHSEGARSGGPVVFRLRNFRCQRCTDSIVTPKGLPARPRPHISPTTPIRCRARKSTVQLQLCPRLSESNTPIDSHLPKDLIDAGPKSPRAGRSLRSPPTDHSQPQVLGPGMHAKNLRLSEARTAQATEPHRSRGKP